jgi:hypothetical protein
MTDGTTDGHIEELKAEIGRLRAALQQIRNHHVGEFGCYGSHDDITKMIDDALMSR